MNNTRESRRNFLEISAWFGLSAVSIGIMGCGSEPTPTPPPPTRQPKSEGPPTPEMAKKKLIEYIDGLPPSSIKKLLIEIVKPLYGDNPPSELVMSGMTIPILENNISEVWNNSQTIHARFTIREPEKTDPTPYYLSSTEDLTLQIPIIPALLQGIDPNRLPDRLGDNTPYITYTIKPNGPSYEGIYPKIVITRPPPDSVLLSKKQYDAGENYAYIKEACGLLLTILFMEETAKKMQENNIQSSIKVKLPGSTGQSRDLEVLPNVITAFMNNDGEFQTAIDTGSYLLGILALRGRDDTIATLQANDRTFASVFSGDLPDVGTSGSDILMRSFKWTFSEPKAQLLPHQGSFDRFPMNIIHSGQKVAKALDNTINAFRMARRTILHL